MNYLKTLSISLFLLAIVTACQDSQKSNLTLFSDQIPTDTPLIFGEGFISTDDFEFAITFSPDMDELFFTRRKWEEDNKVYSMKLLDGKWSEPEVAFFTPTSGWDFEPHINPEGDLLYFGSTRPLSDSVERSGLHQWVSKKLSRGWSQPVVLEKPFVDRFVMYLTSSENGNLYFTSREESVGGGIFYSAREDGQYTSVNRMEKEINFPSGESIAHPYIAPDESYIIYDGKSSSGFGGCDLYISFNKDGTWTEAINLGPEINTDQCEMCASVSPDGKYLFFHRGVYTEDVEEIGNIYWVDFTRLRERIESSN